MNNLKYQTPNIASNMCVDLGGGRVSPDPLENSIFTDIHCKFTANMPGTPSSWKLKKSLDPPPSFRRKKYVSAHATHFIMNQYQHVHIT